jgi:hypothetical protein
MDWAPVTAGRTVRFPGTVVIAKRCGPSGGDGRGNMRFSGTVVTARWRGPDGGDSQEDGTLLRHGDDGDNGGRGQEGGGVVPMAEEERDGTVPGHGGEGRVDSVVPGRGDGVEAVEVASAWTRQRRRGRKKFCQPDDIQVKILRLGFKDSATGGFIGGT